MRVIRIRFYSHTLPPAPLPFQQSAIDRSMSLYQLSLINRIHKKSSFPKIPGFLFLIYKMRQHEVSLLSFWVLAFISLTISTNMSSTFWFVFADVSMNGAPQDSANERDSANVTCQAWEKILVKYYDPKKLDKERCRNDSYFVTTCVTSYLSMSFQVAFVSNQNYGNANVACVKEYGDWLYWSPNP